MQHDLGLRSKAEVTFIVKLCTKTAKLINDQYCPIFYHRLRIKYSLPGLVTLAVFRNCYSLSTSVCNLPLFCRENSNCNISKSDFENIILSYVC